MESKLPYRAFFLFGFFVTLAISFKFKFSGSKLSSCLKNCRTPLNLPFTILCNNNNIQSSSQLNYAETSEPEVLDELSSDISPMKVGVLLLNLGGPEKREDVEGFLYNLFADPDIIRLPSFLSVLQKPLAYVIAKRRAPKSTAAYDSIGGGSPIVQYTQAQASLIENCLQKKGLDAKCYFAMRYWNPYTEEVLEKMQEDGINTIVVVPLYPQYSISTSGSSLKLLQDIFLKNPQTWGKV